MKNILLISLSFVLFGCKMVDINQPSTINNSSQIFEKDYFNNPEADYIFKGQIEIYSNQISTLLVVKRLDLDKFRVAITNDFGNKLLDIEIEKEKHKIVYVAKDLNKKIILNPIISDLLFLTKKSYICRRFENNETVLNADLNNKNKLAIQVLPSNIYQFSILNKKEKMVKKMSIELNDNILQNIFIEHQDLDLKLNYSRILNNNN